MTNSNESLGLHLLADQINEHHNQARIHAGTAIDHALCAGENLLKAKAAAGHGNWRTWLSQNTALTERIAQRYMQLARNRADLVAKAATMADLTVTGAVELLTKEPGERGELSENERQDLVQFMARCRRNKGEVVRLSEACETASEAGDIDGLKEVIRGCDRLMAEDRACRKYAERKIRELRRAA